MMRRLFNVLAVLSLLLCAAVCALWVRSYYVEDTLYFATRERADTITVTRGTLVVEFLVGNHPTPGLRHETIGVGKLPRTASAMGAPPDWQRWGIEWSPSVNLLAVSLWWVLGATAALPLAWVPSRRRKLAGNCRCCGYDLRATPGRCPECGALPQAVPKGAA